jgi:hypothetical protein
MRIRPIIGYDACCVHTSFFHFGRQLMPGLLTGRQSPLPFSAAGVDIPGVAQTPPIYKDALNKLRVNAHPIWSVAQSKADATTYVIPYDIVTAMFRRSVESDCSGTRSTC